MPLVPTQTVSNNDPLTATAALVSHSPGEGRPFIADDTELVADLPEYTPGGFPDGNAFPGAIDLSFHSQPISAEACG